MQLLPSGVLAQCERMWCQTSTSTNLLRYTDRCSLSHEVANVNISKKDNYVHFQGGVVRRGWDNSRENPEIQVWGY